MVHKRNKNINKEIETIMKEPEEIVELKYTINGKIHWRHSTTNWTKQKKKKISEFEDKSFFNDQVTGEKE